MADWKSSYIKKIMKFLGGEYNNSPASRDFLEDFNKFNERTKKFNMYVAIYDDDYDDNYVVCYLDNDGNITETVGYENSADCMDFEVASDEVLKAMAEYCLDTGDDFGYYELESCIDEYYNGIQQKENESLGSYLGRVLLPENEDYFYPDSIRW